jgi:putative ABC transport system permease protein
MNTVHDIGVVELSLALGFILLAGLASLKLKLGLGRDLLWGTVRTIAQLALMGFVLRFIFDLNQWYVVLGVYTVMIFFAARIARSRVKVRSIPVFMPTFVTMLVSYMIVTFIVTSGIVGAVPWYEPKYFIPLGGMIIGNSMSAIAISLERMMVDLKNKHDEVELLMCLGADYMQASASIFRDAVKAGMLPSITAMMGVGIVALPGMMTGQILAGSDPLVAVKYQIMVMLMLVGSTAIGSVLVTYLVRGRCFDDGERLKVLATANDKPPYGR